MDKDIPFKNMVIFVLIVLIMASVCIYFINENELKMEQRALDKIEFCKSQGYELEGFKAFPSISSRCIEIKDNTIIYHEFTEHEGRYYFKERGVR